MLVGVLLSRPSLGLVVGPEPASITFGTVLKKQDVAGRLAVASGVPMKHW